MPPTAPPHRSVLAAPVTELLGDCPDGWVLDATVGAGGHAEAILDARPPGSRLLGLDRDPRALALAGERLARFGDRAVLVHGGFEDVVDLARSVGAGPFAGALADLGVSSMQLDDPNRGFSFAEDGPLDMRMDPGLPESAGALLNRLDERAISRIVREYGDERLSRPIARAIVRARDEGRLETTRDLAEIARACYRRRRIRERIDPATRTFQAIRIAVNRELDQLTAFLDSLGSILVEGAIVCIIAFHSLEDRIVKRRFQDWATDCVCPPAMPVCGCGRVATARVLTRKPIRPDEDEIATNVRARSAKLRAAEWLGTGAAQA